uniref:Uncharacterized protein n=1 Tax=Rhizophora mucronata TaxID=61149 RepID=A0A2P2PHE5_RHIMU
MTMISYQLSAVHEFDHFSNLFGSPSTD